MTFEKVVAWVFLISMVVALWIVTYLAYKVAGMLKELRLLLKTNDLALHVSQNREIRTFAALDKIEHAASKAQVAAAHTEHAATTAATHLASRVAEAVTSKVDEIKAAVQEIKDRVP